jgi:hypothetical protein
MGVGELWEYDLKFWRYCPEDRVVLPPPDHVRRVLTNDLSRALGEIIPSVGFEPGYYVANRVR